MLIYSLKIEIVIPLYPKCDPYEIAIVIPSLVVASNADEARAHAESQFARIPCKLIHVAANLPRTARE